MQRRILPWFPTAALLTLSILALAPSKASATFENPFVLDSGNTGGVGAYTSPYAEVTISNVTGTQATVTFDFLSSGGHTFLFIDQGAVAVNLSSGSVTGVSWTSANTAIAGYNGRNQQGVQSIGSGNEDGFGTFNNAVSMKDGTDQ